MTGTELLMYVAEKFSQEGEAMDIIIVYTDENGLAHLKSNTNYTRSLGLAAWAKADIESKLVSTTIGS